MITGGIEGQTGDGFFRLSSAEMYIKEIRKLPVCTNEEALELIGRVRDGRVATFLVAATQGEAGGTGKLIWMKAALKGVQAMQQLILGNLRLVGWVSSEYLGKYPGKGRGWGDLFNEGVTGLIGAINGFDPERGNCFSTYASVCVYRVIERRDQNFRTIYVPENVGLEYGRVTEIRQNLRGILGREPGYNEIAESAGLPPRRVAEIFEHSLMRQIGSLNEPVFNSEGVSKHSRGDLVADPEDGIGEDFARREVWGQVLGLLTEEERQLVFSRFGLNLAYREIGEQFNLSHEGVRQKLQKIYERLKDPRENPYHQELRELLAETA